MKKIYIFLMALLPLVSCKKFLQEKPSSFLSNNNFYKNAGDAEVALNGVFSTLQPQRSYGRTVWLISELPGELLLNNGTTGVRGELDLWSYSSGNDEITNWWVSLYQMINRANDVIMFVPDINMNEAQKNNVLGNARFLRALGYFELVRAWGGVPLVLTPTLGVEDIRPSRASVAAVYDQIIEDLKFAEANCYPESQIPATQKGRVSNGAAAALLAKVYATKATTEAADTDDYTNALAFCNKVVNSPLYDLLPDYEDVFDVGNESTVEHIFSIQFDLPPNTGNITPRMHIPTQLGGFGSFFVHPSFVAAWDPADSIRKNFNISDKAGAVTVTPYFNKFRDPQRVGNNSRVNWMITRYADVLLLQSEIMNEINPADPNKFNGINEVRARAGLTGAHQLNFTSTPTKDDFIDALVRERAFELCAEGHRRWDLVRLNRVKEVMATIGITVQDKFLLLPIPETEIVLNKNLEQNPGY